MRIFVIISIIVLSACGGEKTFVPKPRMYPRIDFPDREYTTFDKAYCDVTFTYPNYAEIIRDTSFFDEKPLHPCWFDVYFKDLNGRLHCTYYDIEDRQDFDQLLKDAFTFVDKHDIKANYREEIQVNNPYGAGGVLFQIDGPVATPLQFFLTDSTDHFFRASLYFMNQVNPDSMAPIHAFVIEDVKKIIETVDFHN